MTLPSSPSQLAFSQIEGEFGQNNRRSLGDYRIKEPNVGDLGTLGLDNDMVAIFLHYSIDGPMLLVIFMVNH